MGLRKVARACVVVVAAISMAAWCSFTALAGEAAATGRDAAAASEAVARRLDRPLQDFSVTAYGAKEGAPTDVESIAQTPDGFLWLGATEGLIRCDGVEFTQDMPTPLPHKAVAALWTDDNGDLWIGYRYGGISRLSHGQLTDLNEGLWRNSGGQPSSVIFGFARDRDGTLWTADSGHLYRWAKDRWHMMGAADGYSLQLAQTFIGVLPDGALWVTNGTQAWRYDAARHQFDSIDFLRVWEAHIHASFDSLPSDAAAEIKRLSQTPLPGAFLSTTVDQSGAIWSAMLPALTRYRRVSSTDGTGTPAIDRLNRPGVPYGNDVAVLFADREGDIWSGELGGIERFRPNKLRAVAPRETILGPAISRGTHGDMWVGSMQNGSVYNVQDGVATKWPSLGNSLVSISAGKDGAVWFLGFVYDPSFKDMRVLQDGRVREQPYPPGVPAVFVNAIVDDPNGGKLLSVGSGHGLYRLDHGVWSAGPGRPGALDEASTRILADDRGRVWVGYTSNRLALIGRDSVRQFSAADGLSIDNVKAIAVQGDDVWVAGSLGVDHRVGERFVPLRAEDGVDFHSAGGIVKNARGELWINAMPGLYRVAAAELAKAAQDPTYKVHAQLFDQNDGLQGGVNDGRPGPTLVEAGDGTLWAARMEGVSWINPADLTSNTVAPQVQVQSISADGQAWPGPGLPRLKPGTRVVSIAYTATSLSMPEKVLFRYRLDGVDRGWENAGTRRQASYTNLAPGRYSFRVMAANEDGVWSAQEAVAGFVITPRFYQTPWFKLLVAAVALLLLWLLFQLRIRQLNQRQRLRTAEREELSRELHNTLIQGIGSIDLHMQLWSEDPRLPPSLRNDIDKMSRYAGEMMEEGRERIASLRTVEDGEVDWVAKMQAVAEHYAMHRGTALALQQEGQARRLTPAVARAAIDINCEAVRNAFTHAEASQIEVLIRYDEQAFSTRVSDNGQGLPDAVLAEGAKPGHWGLPVMHERAAHAGASLTIRRGESGGTVVSLVVPAARAYPTRWARLRSLFRAEP